MIIMESILQSERVRYFYVRESGRSPLCVVSSNGTQLDQFGIVRMLTRSCFDVEECSFEDMLCFPAKCYSVFVIGSLRIEVCHSPGLQIIKVFKRFLFKHYDRTYTL